jgi:hypothetical protein
MKFLNTTPEADLAHDQDMMQLYRDHTGPYTTTYNRLSVCHLTPEQHERTCNYWYTVNDYATSHVAFTTRQGLDRWLTERGLTLAGDITAEGAYCAITGTYHDAAHMILPVDFYQIGGTLTFVMDNADYTLGIITTGDDGTRTVHHLNPNIHTRPVFDYAATSRIMR